MAARVLFFGALREDAGCGERIVEIPPGVDTVAGLVDWIAGDDHALRSAMLSPAVRIAVDRILVDRAAPLRGAGEIAFMPPFSGG